MTALAAPRRLVLGPADRVAGSPWATCVAIVALTVSGFALDRFTPAPRQWLLGLACWVFLALLLRSATPTERVQTLVVIVVASCFEVVGSIIWGVYIYRHHNLPMFVPPGHGMVYLFGLRFTQTAWARRSPGTLVRIALVGAVGWALIGLTLLSRVDAGGAWGVFVLSVFLVRGRAPQVYAGVFLFVAFLELYGVAMGTWAWKPEIPGTGIPNGNPPSGIASGYVFFDICAIWATPIIIGLWGAVRAQTPQD
ncbi:MAG: hypothetical protein U0Y82_06915 [Thermoleophilia bacterium]